MADDGWARWMRDHGIEADGGYGRRRREAEAEAEARRSREEWRRHWEDRSARLRLKMVSAVAAEAVKAATGDALENAVRYMAFGLTPEAGAGLQRSMRRLRVLRAKLLRVLSELEQSPQSSCGDCTHEDTQAARECGGTA